MLPPDRTKEWSFGMDKFLLVDLVSNFGIEKSISSPADCIKELTDSLLINKIREFID